MEKKTDAIGWAVSLLGDIEFAREATNVRSDRLCLALLSLGVVFGLAGGGFSAEKKNKIGILFDGARFTQMVEGGIGVVFFRLTIELGEYNDGDFQLHGKGFKASGNLRDLDLAIFFATTGS